MNKEEFDKSNVFGKGEYNEGYKEYFSGNSYLNPLAKTDNIFLANVTFEPGCRNNYHIHHASKGGGQILICTAGYGWYKEEGKDAVSLKPGDVITIPIKEKIKNTLVLKTTDYNLNKEIDKIISENNKKVNIKGKIIAKLSESLTLQISDGKNEVIEVGNKVLKAINRPMTKDDVNERLNKLGNTIYKFDNLNIEMDDNVFIPIKELNDIKNNAISKLNEKRLYKYEYIKQEYSIDLKNYKKEK